MPHIRERLAHAIGLDADGRLAIVRAMLERHARDRVGYWFQLAMSTGIATLGLVLGSGGVVIGAMLVSPLMAPLVEFGMGLAVGSPILVVRSFVRTLGSVAGVIAASAAIAWLLPYQRITAEISARTSPTLLDLFVAVFCALAAAFTTVRGSSDTVTAAAGTAIGISLVPPLCVGGYGLGTGLLEVSSGALLLFTANFTAIVLVAVLSFLLLRFDEIDVHAAEQSVLDAGLTTPRAGRWLHALLGARYGRALRIGMPLLVAVTVYFPLRRALTEVSWKIRVQKQVHALLGEISDSQQAIRTSVTVEYRSVAIRLITIGGPQEAKSLERDIRRRVMEVTGVRPLVDVTAVPDLDAVREATVRTRAELSPVVLPPVHHLGDVREDVVRVLAEVWPGGPVGPLLGWKLDLQIEADPTVEVTHLGEPLGASGEELLGTALSTKLGGTVKVREVAYPSIAVTAEPGAESRWIGAFLSALVAVRRSPGIHACVEVPPPLEPGSGKRTRVPPEPASGAAREARAIVAAAQHERLHVADGAKWSVTLSAAGCPAPPAGQAPGRPSAAPP